MGLAQRLRVVEFRLPQLDCEIVCLRGIILSQFSVILHAPHALVFCKCCTSGGEIRLNPQLKDG